MYDQYGTQNLGLIPMVVEQTSRGERSLIFIHVYSKSALFSWSVLWMTKARIWWWRKCCFWNLKTLKDIHFYINSPGGSVSAGMSVYDTMQFIKPDVSTMCIGMAASMGAILLTAGAKGKRYAS